MAKEIYTARAHVVGGRAEGHGVTSDGNLDVALRRPAEMGGEGGGTFELTVGLDVTLPDVTNADDAVALVKAAHAVCPYSNATRGNVEVTLTANGQAVD